MNNNPYDTRDVNTAVAKAIRQHIELEGITPKELGIMAGVVERLAEKEANRALDYPALNTTGTYARLLKALEKKIRVELIDE